MIVGYTRTAQRIARGATRAPENALSDAQDSLASSLARSARSTGCIPRGSMVEIPWKVTLAPLPSPEGHQMGNVVLGLTLFATILGGAAAQASENILEEDLVAFLIALRDVHVF